MSNVLSEEKKQQIIALGRLGWSLRRIERATGVRRETAGEYLRAVGIAVGGRGRRNSGRSGKSAGGGVATNAKEAKAAIKVTTGFLLGKPANEAPVSESAEANPAKKTSKESEPAKAAIKVTTGFPLGKSANETPVSESAEANPAKETGNESEPARPAIEVPTGSESVGGTNIVAGDSGTEPRKEAESSRSQGRSPTASKCEAFREEIEMGLSRGRNAMAIWQDLVSYHGFEGGYQSVKRFASGLRGPRTREACGIIITAPGEESQVDYGQGPMVRDSKSGKYRRTRLFVMTLGYSRKSVRLITFRSSTEIWAKLHEQAFRRLGGVTKTVVLDNLREGVLTPDTYDPALNPVYRDMLTHYGAVAMPCRVRDPDRKGKVESGVGHAQKTPLKGQRFESIEEAQEYLDRWEQNWADTRIHGTTKRQVATMFAEERSALLPLPLEPFRYYKHGERTVHLDGCVEVEAAYYGAPPGWVGRLVNVQWDGLTVRLLNPGTGQLLREHLRQKRGHHRIKPEDYPKQVPLSTSKLLWRAEQAGRQIGVLCQTMHRQQGQSAIRRIQGVLSLARKYGAASVEDACAAALELGVSDYRFVRRYLERSPQPSLTLRQVDPLIRELVEYRDLINSRTKEVTE
ncbi:MAG: IS21 family transposase [Gemmatimonadaceae bacterium]